MKLAVLSESSADEAALRVLIDGILRRQTERVSLPPLRTRGWPSVREILPTILKHLHYQSDAEALVLVVDSNHSPPHEFAHDQPGGVSIECRLCQLRQVTEQVRRQLTPVPNRAPLKLAIGLAVPAIEAWYRVGRDPQVSEAAWTVGLHTGVFPYSKNELKRAVYGTDRPPLPIEEARALQEADRLAANPGLLEEKFSVGFGTLAREVRAW